MDCREAELCVSSSPDQIHTPDSHRYTTGSPASVRPCCFYGPPFVVQQQQSQPLPAFSYTQPTPHRGVVFAYAGAAHGVSAHRTRRTNSVPSAQRSLAPERYSTGRRWQERRDYPNNNNNTSHVSSGEADEGHYFSGCHMIDAMPSCATVCLLGQDGPTGEGQYYTNNNNTSGALAQRRVSYGGGGGCGESNGMRSNACPLLSPFLLGSDNAGTSACNGGGLYGKDAMQRDSPSWWSLGRPTCLVPVDTHSGLTPNTERRTGHSVQPDVSENGARGNALQPRAHNVRYDCLPGTKKKKTTTTTTTQLVGRSEDCLDDENMDQTAEVDNDDEVTGSATQTYYNARAMALPCGLGRHYLPNSDEGSVSPGEQDSSLVRLSCLGPPTQRIVKYGEGVAREGVFTGVGRELFATNESEVVVGANNLSSGGVCEGVRLDNTRSGVPNMTVNAIAHTPPSSPLDGAPRKAYPAMSHREKTLQARRDELHRQCDDISPEVRCETTRVDALDMSATTNCVAEEGQSGRWAALREAQQASWTRALRHESDWLPQTYDVPTTRTNHGVSSALVTDSFADEPSMSTTTIHPLADFALRGARPCSARYNINNMTQDAEGMLGPYTPHGAPHSRRVFRPCCSLDSPSRPTTGTTTTVCEETQDSMEIDAQMAQLAVQASPTQKRLAFDDVDDDDDDNSAVERGSRASSSLHSPNGNDNTLYPMRNAGGTMAYGGSSMDRWLAHTRPGPLPTTFASRRSTLLLGPAGFTSDDDGEDEEEQHKRVGKGGVHHEQRQHRRAQRIASPTLHEPSLVRLQQQPSSSLLSSSSLPPSLVASRTQSRRELRTAGHTSTVAMMRRGAGANGPLSRKRNHSKSAYTGQPASGLELLHSRKRFLQEMHAEESEEARTQCMRHVGGDNTCKNSTASRHALTTSLQGGNGSCTTTVSGVHEGSELSARTESLHKRFRLERASDT